MNLNLMFKSHRIEIRFVIILPIPSYFKNTKGSLIRKWKEERSQIIGMHLETMSMK